MLYATKIKILSSDNRQEIEDEINDLLETEEWYLLNLGTSVSAARQGGQLVLYTALMQAVQRIPDSAIQNPADMPGQISSDMDITIQNPDDMPDYLGRSEVDLPEQAQAFPGKLDIPEGDAEPQA